MEEVFNSNSVNTGSTSTVNDLSSQESMQLGTLGSNNLVRTGECHDISQEDCVSSYVAGAERVVTSQAASVYSEECAVPSYVVGEQEADIASAAYDYRSCESNSEPRVPSIHVDLNPVAEPFVMHDQSRIHQGRLGVSLLDDVRHVQHVQAGQTWKLWWILGVPFQATNWDGRNFLTECTLFCRKFQYKS